MMALVEDDQPEITEAHVGSEQPVGADDDVDLRRELGAREGPSGKGGVKAGYLPATVWFLKLKDGS